MFGADCGGAAADQLWTRQAEVPGLPVPHPAAVHYRYSRIEVKRGYEIKLVLDANYRQFLDGKIDYGVGYLIEKTDIRHRKVAGQMKKMTA